MLFRRSGSYVSIGAAAAVVLANGTIGEGDRKRMKNGVVCWFEQADQRVSFAYGNETNGGLTTSQNTRKWCKIN